MQQSQFNNSPGLAECILSGSVEQLTEKVREAAAECHSAISKLTLRSEAKVRLLHRFALETNSMLSAVTLIKNYLLQVCARIKTLTNESHVRRYLKTVQILEDDTGSISDSKRQSLEHYRDKIISRKSSTLRRLREDVRTLLVLRLEMLGYWRWFLKQATKIYTTFKHIVRENLRRISGEIQDPVLQKLVITALSTEEGVPTEMLNSVRERLPTTFSELERQAVKELEDLSAIESQLLMVKASAAELENSEAVIRREIQQSIPTQDAEEPPITKQILLRGLEMLEETLPEDQKSPRTLVFKRVNETE